MQYLPTLTLLLALLCTTALPAQLTVKQAGQVEVGNSSLDASAPTLLIQNESGDYNQWLTTLSNGNRWANYTDQAAAVGENINLTGGVFAISNRGTGRATGLLANLRGYEYGGTATGIFASLDDQGSRGGAAYDYRNSLTGIYANISSRSKSYAYGIRSYVNNRNPNADSYVYGINISGTRTPDAQAKGYGLFVDFSGPDDHAGYFRGRVHITGDLTVGGMYPGQALKSHERMDTISNALSIIEALRPRSAPSEEADGRRKSRKKRARFGFVADEVADVLPGLVSTTHNPPVYEEVEPRNAGRGRENEEPTQPERRLVQEASTTQSIKVLDLVPILVQAIREQNGQIKQLEGQLREVGVETPARKSLINEQAERISAHDHRLAETEQLLREVNDELARVRQGLQLLKNCTDCGTSAPRNARVIYHEESVSYYPNPASDQVTVNNQLSDRYQLRVSTADGRLFATVEATSKVTRLSTADWPAGLYLFTIYEGKQLIDQRSIVVKR